MALEFQKLLAQVAEGKILSHEQAQRALQIMLSGGATPAHIAAFLIGLKIRGETVGELLGAAEVMRAKSPVFSAPEGAIDTCGTGGDGLHTVNISTAVALVVAACGVPVVKHGNRAVSSRSGSADVLTALGVNIMVEPDVLQECLTACNLCFLFAPKFHAAMRHVAPVRQELGFRTLFNLVGPLSNPARPSYQLLGVYSRHWVEPLAEVLRELGLKRAWVVHGHEGEDELSIAGPSYVAELKDGEIHHFEISPEDVGLPLHPLQALKGGNAEENAHALQHMLSGEPGAYRDAVLFNAAAALLIAGKAGDLSEGITLAAEAIDSRAAKQTLADLIFITNPEIVESEAQEGKKPHG